MAERLELSQFPLLSALPRGPRYLSQIVATVNQALSDGRIPNPKFQDLKYNLSNLVDEFQEKIGREHTHGGRWENVPPKIYSLDLTLGSPLHIPGKVKKLEKLKDQHPLKDDYLRYAAEFKPILDAVEFLKSKIVKRQPKSTKDQPAKFVIPLASSEAFKKVAAVLIALTDSIKEEYAAQQFAYYVRIIEHFVSLTPEEQRKGQHIGSSIILQKVRDYQKQPEFVLLPNWRNIAKRQAAGDAIEMQQRFLFKNVRKLAKIIELKNDLKGDPTILHAGAGSGVFEGEIRFEFEDGSQFDVRNKIIVNTSVHGRAFNQFPTTFHNVRLAGGKKIPMNASERQMVVTFAGGTVLDLS